MDLNFTTDAQSVPRATMALVILQTDETIEHEFSQIIPSDIGLYHSRVPNAAEVNQTTLAKMEAEIPRATALLPSASPLSVVGYGCTSGATVIGEDQVAAAVRSARPDVQHVTNPLSAMKAAFTALGTKRIGLLTPYVESVSSAMRENLEQNGFEISAFGSFNESQDNVVARISTESILAGLEAVAKSGECDVLFASCTNLRCLSIIDEAEKRTGLPVTASNQVLAWHMMRLAGIDDQPIGMGKLFQV